MIIIKPSYSDPLISLMLTHYDAYVAASWNNSTQERKDAWLEAIETLHTIIEEMDYEDDD